MVIIDIDTYMQKLTAKEYYSLEAPILFSEEDNRFNKHLGFFSIGEQKYKFSWNSEIEPAIELLSSSIYGIGIDQHFCLLNSACGAFCHWDLDTPFLFMMVYEKNVFVICETNILIISLDFFKTKKEYMFYDIVSQVEFENWNMRIRFISNKELVIPLHDDSNPHLVIKDACHKETV